MIRHERGKWVLYTSDGSRRLGTHSSRSAAQRQEAAIYARRAAHKAITSLIALGEALRSRLEKSMEAAELERFKNL